MAMLYLVDIEAACRVEALLEATREVSSCKVVYGLKVVGENRLVLVVDGDVDKLTAAMGSCMSGEKVSCSPLRTYDGFARNVLGVSETIAKPDAPRITGEQLYWLHFQVEYKGMTQDALFQTWKEEAEAALGLSNKGILKLFKVVGQRVVYALVKADNPEAMDDITFQLPIMKQMGDNVHILTKEVKLLH